MPPRKADSQRKKSPPETLEQFLKRVLREQSTLTKSINPDAVHDLRVALRRCRSLSEGFATLDDHRDWRRLRKSAKKLQGSLAALRDAQVMGKGTHQLRLTGGKAGAAVSELLRRDERKGKKEAERALKKFPRKRWKRWRHRLPKWAARLDAAPITFADLVLERANEVISRERRWHTNHSQVTAHSLRIAVKHFRYTVQSFLPEQYAAWERDLKRMQDALGEMHDLDVLRGWLLKAAKRESLDHDTMREWLARIAEARAERVERYKKASSVSAKTGERGKHSTSLWVVWHREIEHLAEFNSPNYGEVSA
jgi:CHAD domain-containing protein